MTFRITWAIGALVALVAIAFFVIGLADGSVSSFNMGLWMGLLAALTGVLVGSHLLHRRGHPRAATLLAMVLAVPGVLAVLFMALVMGSGSRWN